jgi:hypothetical protein
VSDSRLRRLERRWRETGTARDEEAWLQERVRVGDLPQERLRLKRTLAQEDWPIPQRVMYAFVPCGPESWQRAAIALAARLAPHLADEHPDAWQPVSWLRRAEDFVLQRPVESPQPFLFGPVRWDFEDQYHDIDDEAHERACREFASDQAWHAYRVLQLVRRLPEWEDVSEATGVLMTVLDRVELKTALAVLRAELVPWLLGYSDPIRDRVEARPGEAPGE